MQRTPLPAITFEALAERVTQSLREAIITGVLQPGERLVEERIAAEMGVSRAPIRDALRILESEGLVRSLPRRGVAVAIPTKRDVQEIYGLRSALECQAARTACKTIMTPDVNILLSLAGEMRSSKVAKDRKLLATIDLAFHKKILEVAGNQRLLESWLSIMSQVRLLQRHVLTSTTVNMENLARNHEVIAEALQSGDPDLAEARLREHIERIGHEVFESFPDSTIEPPNPRPHASISHRATVKISRQPL